MQNLGATRRRRFSLLMALASSAWPASTLDIAYAHTLHFMLPSPSGHVLARRCTLSLAALTAGNHKPIWRRPNNVVLGDIIIRAKHHHRQQTARRIARTRAANRLPRPGNLRRRSSAATLYRHGVSSTDNALHGRCGAPAADEDGRRQPAVLFSRSQASFHKSVCAAPLQRAASHQCGRLQKN